MTSESADVDGTKLPGLAVLHLFFKVGTAVEVGPATLAIAECITAGNQVISAEIYGHKADFALTALGESFSDLRHLQTGLVGAGLDLVSSYVSLTEVSEYEIGR